MPHIQILISIVCLAGVSHLLKLATPIRSEMSFFHACLGVSLILYAGALVGLVPETALGIRIAGGVGLCLMLQSVRRKRLAVSPYQILIVVSIGGFYLLCQTSSFRTFSQVDDFGYWGRASRAIFESNALLTKNDPISHLDYPPIAALFQYFFTHFSGFEDRTALFAQGVLVITGSCLLLRPLRGLTGIASLTIFSLALVGAYSLFWVFSSWFLTVSLGTLSTDLLLGLCFGLALHVYFNQNTNDKSSALFSAIPICLFMILLKPIGILFALIAIGVIFLDYLQNSSQTFFYSFLTLTTTLGIVFLTYASWKIHLRHLGISETFTTKFTANDIYQAFNTTSATERQALTIDNFIKQLFFSFDQSTYWFLVCLLCFLAIFFTSKATRVKFFILPYLSVLMGFFGYLFVLLLLYMFSFSEWEGTRLASIDRYTKTYIVGALFFLWGRLIFLNQLETITKTGATLFIGIALLLAVPNLTYVKRDFVRLIFKTDRSYVDNVVATADQVLSTTPSNSKIYFVYSDGSNDESNVFNYLITPRKSNKDCSFIRPPFSADVISQPWFCKLSLEDFKTKLSGYDFVVFAKVSQEFIDYYLHPLKIDQHRSVIFSVDTLMRSAIRP